MFRNRQDSVCRHSVRMKQRDFCHTGDMCDKSLFYNNRKFVNYSFCCINGSDADICFCNGREIVICFRKKEGVNNMLLAMGIFILMAILVVTIIVAVIKAAFKLLILAPFLGMAIVFVLIFLSF